MQQSGARTHRVPGDAAMQRGERFRSAITALAAKKGLFSDVALAEAAGVSTNTLGNWWKGKGLELGTLVAVAGVLDQSVFDLLDVWQGREDRPVKASLAEVAVTSLVAALDADRVERQALTRAIRALVRSLPIPSGAEESPARRVPRRSTG